MEEVLALLEDVFYLKGVVLIFQVIKPGLVVYCSFLLPEDRSFENGGIWEMGNKAVSYALKGRSLNH